MAVTYFGGCNSDGTPIGESTYTGGNGEMDWITAGYTCPGSGNQTVLDLKVYGRNATGNVRVGIYSGTTLVCEGNAKVAIASNTWCGHTNTSLTWHNGYSYLTGGNTYIIAVASDAGCQWLGTSGAASGTSKYGSGSADGLPDPLPAGTNYTWSVLAFRCGVEPAATAQSVIIVADNDIEIAIQKSPTVTAIQSLFNQRKHVKMIF